MHRTLAMTLLAWSFALTAPSRADSIVLVDGHVLSGTVLRTNGSELFVIQRSGTTLVSTTNVQSVVSSNVFPYASASRIPGFEHVLLTLNTQSWASSLKQIPASVIDRGPMKNVPYVSFRCGETYEINVYGDLANPAGVEVGVYGRSTTDSLAKIRCENLVSSLVLQDDQFVVRALNWEGDLKVKDGLTFEVTPPSAPDAYGGWWISVYSESQLEAARATDAELKEITMSNAASDANSEWTLAEMSLARRTRPTHITFKSLFGTIITNAEVVRVNNGVSLDWKDSLGSGTVRLADLPHDLRILFGFDPDREAADSAHRAQVSARQRAIQAELDAKAPPLPPRAPPDPGFGMGYGLPVGDVAYGGGSGYYPGRTVFVRSYTRSDGTFVRAHTRSAPGRGGRR
jgi:hypothetical protein